MEYCLRKPCGKLTPLLSISNDRAVADWNDTEIISIETAFTALDKIELESAGLGKDGVRQAINIFYKSVSRLCTKLGNWKKRQ